MSDYPRMMFRAGTAAVLHGYECDTRVVDGPDEEAEALASGWASSPAEAHSGDLGHSDDPDALRADLKRAAELLAEARAERDDAIRAAVFVSGANEWLRAKIAPFDRDGDGKPGG